MTDITRQIDVFKGINQEIQNQIVREICWGVIIKRNDLIHQIVQFGYEHRQIVIYRSHDQRDYNDINKQHGYRFINSHDFIDVASNKIVKTIDQIRQNKRDQNHVKHAA
ncbi:hypothetical protein D3C74_336450 [compost metagenome]